MDKFLMILCESLFGPNVRSTRDMGVEYEGGLYGMYSQNKLYDYIDLRAKNRGKNFCYFVLSFVCGGGGREKYRRKV